MERTVIKLATGIRNMSPRKTSLFAIIGVVLLIGLMVVWSNHQWQQYVSQNNIQYDQARAKAVEQLNSVETIDDIETTINSLDEAAVKLCQSSFMTDTRSKILSEAKEYQQDCQVKRDKLVNAKAQMQHIYVWLIAENRVAKVIDKTTTDLKEAKNNDYVAQQKLWRQTKADLDNLEIDDSYSNLKKSYSQTIESVIKRYDGLIAANKAEKRSQFDDAAVELRESYSEFSSVEAEGAAKYHKLAQQVYDAMTATTL